jgi:hypothetical protein
MYENFQLSHISDNNHTIRFFVSLYMNKVPGQML